MVSPIERFHCIQDSQLGLNGVLYREVPLYIYVGFVDRTYAEVTEQLHTMGWSVCRHHYMTWHNGVYTNTAAQMPLAGGDSNVSVEIVTVTW